MDPRSEEKRRRLERTLEKGVAMIHLDARRPGVQVPARLREDFHLRLNLSLRYDPPDLTVNEWGVRETLSFGGARFAVAVPWPAIFAITGAQNADQAHLYPEDMPRELIEEAARQFGLSGEEVEQLQRESAERQRAELAPAPDAAAPEAPAGEPKPRPGLRVVDSAPPPAPAAVPEPPPEPDKPKRGHLRLIK